MKILNNKSASNLEILKKTLKVLKAGGLVVAPSDTVYGLLADAQNQVAVDKLLNFKDRPKGKPISVFVGDLAQAYEYVKIGKKEAALMNKLAPGPFTFVLPSRGKIDKRVESEEGSLGVRLPDFEFINNLVEKFGRPITATSANLAGRPPHYSVESFLHSLPSRKAKLIDLIIDFGPLPRKKPSTVVDLAREKIAILRQGDLQPKASHIQSYITKNEAETKRLAIDLAKKLSAYIKKHAAVIIFKGDLGVGKTIFVKGMGEYLKTETIISPTYVICYEYACKTKPFSKLHHCDFYHIEKVEEFKYLGIESMLQPGNLICIEWGEKSGEIFAMLQKKAKIITVSMKYIDEETRKISINNQ